MSLSSSKVPCFPGEKIYLHSSQSFRQSGISWRKAPGGQGGGCSAGSDQAQLHCSQQPASLSLPLLECAEGRNRQTEKSASAPSWREREAACSCPRHLSVWPPLRKQERWRFSQALPTPPPLVKRCVPATQPPSLGASGLEMCREERPGGWPASSFSFFSVINFVLSSLTKRNSRASIPDRNHGEKQMGIEINNIAGLDKCTCSGSRGSLLRSRKHPSDLVQPMPRLLQIDEKLTGPGGGGRLFPYICPGKVNQSKTETGESQGYSDSVKKIKFLLALCNLVISLSLPLFFIKTMPTMCISFVKHHFPL